MLERLKAVLLGGPKNLFDPRIHHTLALIAFFAWIGLGSDGLSSSCYGPQAAFLELGAHRHLAFYLIAATVLTVFLISASYSQIIELFPSGGGGYLVATKLLGPVPGVVSGSALVIDYVLTISTSVAAGVNAVLRAASLELGPRGVVCMAFHPGWVRTDMGGSGAAIDVVESVSSLRRVIAHANDSHNGKFLNYTGEHLSW